MAPLATGKGGIMQTRTRDEAVTAAVQQGAWGLLAHAFRYPDAEMMNILTDRNVLSSLRDATSQLSKRQGAALTSILEHLDGAHSVSVEVLRDSYARLFGLAVRGQCPAYELEYGRRDIVQQAPELADIVGFYTAFGLLVSDDSHERADHVSVESEFMSVLSVKEAWARSVGDEMGLETVLDAQRAFLTDHLGRWFPTFARRVSLADEDGFYGSLTAFGLDFIAEECERLDVPRASGYLELAPADAQEDASISCGHGECGPGSARDEFVPLRVEGQCQS